MTKSLTVNGLRLWSAQRREGAYTCLSCRAKALHGRSRPSSTRTKASSPRGFSRAKYASSLASATAVNASREIRQPVRELYQRLEDLKLRAGAYVNLSRLQLALRSLETQDPVVRIAVLGLNDREPVRALVRALLADPLCSENEATWEKIVQSRGNDDGRALLIRYGDEVEFSSTNTPLDTISIPSPILRSQNLEILVSNLGKGIAVAGDSDGTSKVHEAFLVPFVETPISGTGRSSMINYPVHRAVLFGQGLESVLGLGRYIRSQDLDQISVDVLKIAVGVPLGRRDIKTESSDRVLALDVPLASAAIDKFRESTENAIEYERKWFESGLPALADWVSRDGQKPTGEIKPVVADLINSTLDAALERISNEEAERLQALVTSTVSSQAYQSLSTSLTAWAERAHTELRYNLDVAFEGRKWKRLQWWKMFWRVDDVEMVTTDILDRRWLADAEKDIIWLSGRVGEELSLKATEPIYDEDVFLRQAGPRFAAQKVDDDQILMPVPRPWPTQIPTARQLLVTSTIDPLQRRAQSLVLQTLSTTALSSAFSTLVYYSTLSTSIYEAGVFAVFGLVWSLRRLQKHWEAARVSWEGEVRETGRKALKDTEDMMRGIIDELGKSTEDVEGAEARKSAREAVEETRSALDELKKS
ncbi:MAG: hypothetical protein M4579_002216 [Chaenotheca gracillima]|nr:MAG: hypothetical protein M4579_002216 [Chaenotheca gracillima]